MKTSSKHVYFLLLLLFAGSFSILAQTSLTSPGKYYPFKNYAIEDGLLNNNIYTMVQDRQGYVWFGSYGGLTRFDGKTFFHKAIPEIYNNSATVVNLETTTIGTIISTCTMQGVFVQQDDGRFKQYLPAGYKGIGINSAYRLKTCPDSSLLISERDNLFRLKNDSITAIYRNGAKNMCMTIDIDKDNNVWFAGHTGLGVLQLTGAEYEPVYLPEFNDKAINKILFDNNGTMHVGTSEGYYRIKWQQPYSWNGNYTVEALFPQIKDIYINNIYLDKERNLWILTSSYGVFKTKGDSITLHLTNDNGLASSLAFCMLQDSEGNYWFGTNGGVSMIENFEKYALSKDGKLFNRVGKTVLDAYNRFWIRGQGGITIYQNETLLPLNLKGTPFEKTGMGRILLYDSYLWIVDNSGLYRLAVTEAFPDMRKLEKVVDFSPYQLEDMEDLIPDTDGIWICSTEKLLFYSNHRVFPVTFNHADSTKLRPVSMLRDQYGYYWCGNVSHGLYRGSISQPQKGKLLYDNITAYQSLNVDSSFVTAWVNDMCFDKMGNLWIISGNTGAYKLALDSNGVSSYKLYSPANGLSSTKLQKIKCDEEGRIWIAGINGYDILKFDENGNESIEHIGKNEGVLGVGLYQIQKDGKLYLVTNEGFFIIPDQLFKGEKKEMPPVVITNFMAGGIPVSAFFNHTGKIRLAHSHGNITIEYSAITFKNTDEIRYQYKLEGADNDWSPLSERGFVEYASLRPGKYMFKVRATLVGAASPNPSKGGGFSPPSGELEGASLAFRILPVFYQTVWFYSLIAIGILSLLYAFHKYRLRHVIMMERMRMRIASDLHDDIGSTLSSISLISEMASRQDQESALAKALSKIGNDSRDVLNSMDDIIWSVNPQNDSLSSLIIRLREYAIPVCESKDITFEMNLDEIIHSIKLGMDERRNIYLIVKEAINNAVKHSGCSRLLVAFILKQQKQLEITITDNGCGFDPSIRSLRNGIANMEHRAKQIGMEFIVKTSQDSGTRILLVTNNQK